MLAVHSELNSANLFPDILVQMNNIDHQNRSTVDSTNNNTTTYFNQQQLMVSDADSQLLTENANAGFDIANEIKRWQQLHQSSNNGTTSTALLSNVGTNLQHDASTTAFLQQMIDSQQQQNQRGTSNRFDIPLANTLTLTGNAFGQMVGNASNNDINNGSNDLFNTDNINNVSGSNGNQFGVNLNMPGSFYTDPRLLMAQQAVAAMNFPSFSNSILFQQPQQNQQQQPIFPQLSSLQQDDTNNFDDLPLPSPHSLFHRDGTRRMRGGVIEPFPEKLHRLLLEVEAAGRSDVISFVSSGRAFQIHKADKFFKDIVPLYFRQSRLSSFKRQLNLYGFELINTGPSRGGYFHELFIKDQPDLCRRMRRVAVKLQLKSDDRNVEEEGESNDNNIQGSDTLDLNPSSSDIGRFDF